MNSKTKMRYTSNKGITLIALVITIIVLLILAGVTINMVLGDDGIIAQAQFAKKAQKEGSIEEELEIIKGEVEIEKYGGKKADLEDEDNDGITAKDVIKRLVKNKLAKEGELEEISPYTIGYVDSSNSTQYSLRGVIKWNNEQEGFEFEDDKNTILKVYTGNEKNIIIPEGVTTIGDGVFSWTNDIESISVPEGVTKIGNSTFEGCDVKIIEIPNTLKIIGDLAFANSSLEKINIPESVTEIGSGAFGGCQGLTSINIPKNITKIEEAAFDGCDGLTSINIPESVTSINFSAFSGCASLTNIKIPNGVTEIGWEAFNGCTALKSINIPNGVTGIGYGTFRGCKKLEKIEIPASVTEIAHDAFEGCTSLTSIKIETGSELNTSADGGYPWGVDESKAADIIKFNQTLSQ